MNNSLAKLLATENITVQVGNYNTAWFDIKSRVLGLPDWKDMSKDVEDLFIGHEVGHALFTPYEGWHDSPEKLEGCPRSYINVVEDARIEKNIKSKYPGLVGPMARGYTSLVAKEFFGDLTDIDWDNVKLIDKINLKAKIGTLLNVPMNSEESALYNATMVTESFEDVLNVVRDILAYTKENQEELIQKPETLPDFDESDTEENDDPTTQGHDDFEQTPSEEQEATEEEPRDGEESDDSEEPGQAEKAVASPLPEHSDEDVSITDEIFRAKEKDLIPESANTFYANDVKDVTPYVIPFKDLMSRRKEVLERYNHEYEDGTVNKKQVLTMNMEVEFKKYLSKVKKAVQPAVKEFEQKKAAHQWQYATTAKTGRIDVNKLHSYKISEDIFSQTTNLANSKNHGMFMLIDYSGSMAGVLSNVLEQLIHSIIFCKTVNIPFDVYAFTTGGNHDYTSYRDGDFQMDNLSMPQLIHSDLKKNDFELALKYLYARMECARGSHDYSIYARCEEWGSTPLNHALVCSHKLIKKFKAIKNLEKVNLMLITDGDTNRLSIIEDRSLSDKKLPTTSSYYGYDAEIKTTIDGKKLTLAGRGVNGTKSLLQNLKKRYGVNVIGFYIADSRGDLNSAIFSSYRDQNKDANDWDTSFDKHKKIKLKERNKNKCIEYKNSKGYDNLYIVLDKEFSADEDEFEATSDQTKSQITRAFKKYSSSKKVNKSLMSKFGQAVA